MYDKTAIISALIAYVDGKEIKAIEASTGISARRFRDYLARLRNDVKVGDNLYLRDIKKRDRVLHAIERLEISEAKCSGRPSTLLPNNIGDLLERGASVYEIIPLIASLNPCAKSVTKTAQRVVKKYKDAVAIAVAVDAVDTELLHMENANIVGHNYNQHNSENDIRNNGDNNKSIGCSDQYVISSACSERQKLPLMKQSTNSVVSQLSLTEDVVPPSITSLREDQQSQPSYSILHSIPELLDIVDTTTANVQQRETDCEQLSRKERGGIKLIRPLSDFVLASGMCLLSYSHLINPPYQHT